MRGFWILSGFGVLDATSSSRVAKFGGDVQSCFAATYRQILLGRAIVGIPTESKRLQLWH